MTPQQKEEIVQEFCSMFCARRSPNNPAHNSYIHSKIDDHIFSEDTVLSFADSCVEILFAAKINQAYVDGHADGFGEACNMYCNETAKGGMSGNL